jgi:serine/threonine protein kinase
MSHVACHMCVRALAPHTLAQEHLFLVCELLRANLYEFQKYNRDSGDEPYFSLARIQHIARQLLQSVAFLHSLGLIHADLKPENVLIKSYSRWSGQMCAWMETDRWDGWSVSPTGPGSNEAIEPLEIAITVPCWA